MNETAKHIILQTCWDYEIRVYPVPVYGYGERVKICVEKRGKPKIGEQVFNQFAAKDKTNRNLPNPELWNEIDKIYKYYYNQILQKKAA